MTNDSKPFDYFFLERFLVFLLFIATTTIPAITSASIPAKAYRSGSTGSFASSASSGVGDVTGCGVFAGASVGVGVGVGLGVTIGLGVVLIAVCVISFI